MRTEGDPTRVRVVARTEEAAATLSLRLIDPVSGEEGPPILGDQVRREGDVEFAPRYPLSPGQRYCARLDAPGRAPLAVEYRVPDRPARDPATVESIYPSGDRLPANLLKFYIHFSRPMREGESVFDRIRLIDDRGREIGDPWRRVDLWTPDARRLTLYVHPGRIKRGVNLREEFGPVLEPGRSYTLVLGAELEDEQGQPVGKEVRKTFTALAEERTRPSISDWTIEAPAAGTIGPLSVGFPKPMDRWLALKYIDVPGVRGTAKVGAGERSWIFTPEHPWKAGDYALKIDGFLEDLAGNTPIRLFEEDVKERSGPPGALSRPFRIEPR